MNTRILIAMLACCTAWASVARAETCTISGRYTYAPTDMYYCDSNRMNCSGWTAPDLDLRTGTNATPVRFIRIRIRNSANTVALATTHTDGNGNYQASFSSDLFGAGAQCEGKLVTMNADFMRIDERDLASATPRYRFRVTNQAGTVQTNIRTNRPLATNGNATVENFLKPQTDTDPDAHYFAVFYTMDSAVSEIVNWSTNLRDSMTSATAADQQPIIVDSSFNGSATTESSGTKKGKIWLPYTGYRSGGTIRHELGHWVLQLMHHKNLAVGGCVDGRYPVVNPNPPSPGDQTHLSNSCEYGFFSMLEGTATFIGVRSATSADTNTWQCWAASAAVRDACAADVAEVPSPTATDADGDGVTSFWQILGDVRSDRSARCANLDSASCGCGANCATAAQKNANGFRLETQVARFEWDLLDSSTDLNGVDTIDYSMGQVVQAFEGMSCTTALGQQGTCNEATLAGGLCKKDAYNPLDLSARLSLDETQVRVLNCVNTAPN